MRVGILGHAGLYVETQDQRVLVDPVFENTLLDGILEYLPARRLDLERMPAPTAIVVTHAHFDHYHLPSLERLPRDLPVIVSLDERVIVGLRRLGFSDVRLCAPWDSVTLGKTRLLATPSAHDEPEIGVVLADDTGTFWHMADAEVTPEDGARVLRAHGRVDVVSAKYQPVVRASMGYLRTRGARFDTEEVVQWLETACAVEPGLVFPYASGLGFAGRHAWFNRYAFPLSADEAADLLRQRLGPARAASVEPGDAVDVDGGRCTHQRQVLPFVATVPTPPVVWEPVDVSTLAGLDDEAERARLEEQLDQTLAGSMGQWFERELERPGGFLQPLRKQAVIWQLVVETGGGRRIERYIECGKSPCAIGRGRHPRARSFTHVSGRGLLDALEKKIPGIVFWLAGDARSYEKNILVQDGRLVAPPVPVPEDEIGDPLTYFMRYYGPRGERLGQPERPPAAAPEPAEAAGPEDVDDVWLLARQGEKPAVIAKKALLGLLAEQEAERLALEVSEADVQVTSDTFRAQCGLHDPEETRRWFQRAGLTDASYTRVMRRYTAVRLVQERRAADIAAILDDHARVATARHER